MKVYESAVVLSAKRIFIYPNTWKHKINNY